jgi:hypothetical protein
MDTFYFVYYAVMTALIIRLYELETVSRYPEKVTNLLKQEKE